MSITIFQARRIITLDAARPEATHVAVAEGRIVGVGDLDTLAALGRADLDKRFADQVLLPGFVEGHVHADAGNLWRHTYLGRHERTDPAGRKWAGVPDGSGAVERLVERAANAHGGLVFGWGYDPLLQHGRLGRAELDRVSDRRPVVVGHASGHVLVLNTPALRAAGLLSPRAAHPGLPVDPDGSPQGELRGPEVMLPAAQALGLVSMLQYGDGPALWDFAALCRRAGVTTATDLANPLDDSAVAALETATADEAWPIRIVPALLAISRPAREAVARARELRSRSTDRLRLGALKAVADGSIQAYTARLAAPGYHDGSPNGLWYMAPEELRALYEAALDAGLQVHTHTNGDQASELALDCMEAALAGRPPRDHRFTLQHAQLMDTGMFKRLAALGGAVNLFVNHLWYWGDAHRAHTVGPQRAARMNACRSALDAGLPLAIHSDEPVTPMSPLFSAWCAVNRLTSSGLVLGTAERITVPEALHAITLGAAWTLGLDTEIGSIEPGKRADFAVLADDPLGVPADRLRDIEVLGTVLGGRVQLSC
jgi:predicted amidohydrolase YtcJ